MTLQEFRHWMLWSRAELARTAKLDYKTVTKMERGEKMSSRTAAAVLAVMSTELGYRVSAQEAGIKLGE